MISVEQYFRNPSTGEARPHTKEHEEAADDLLTRRNALRQEWMDETGKACPVCPNTHTEISGSKGSTGDGGFRLPDAATGKALSSHKEAKGVDDFDPANEFDAWLDLYEDGQGGNSKLEEYGLYREAPADTHGWTHLTTRAPHSGHRTFKP